MRAVVKTEPTGGTKGTSVIDRETPRPGRGEVLIKVAAAALCGTDRHIYHWDHSIQADVRVPLVYGHEFCGHVEELGPGTERSGISPGDYVTAEMHVVCGRCRQCRSGLAHVCADTKVLGIHDDGAFADYVKVPASNVITLDVSRVPVRVGAFLDALGNAVHATSVVDLAGRSVCITGFGPIGAMSAAIAEHCGASTVVVTDVSDHALETARRWAARRSFANLHAFNPSSDPDALRNAVMDITRGNGVDVILEMSGAPSAINFGLDIVAAGGFMSLLGMPSGCSVLVEEYTKNVIVKGITIQGIIGRRMFDTWQRMLALLEGGLDVCWLVQAEFDSLDAFHDGMAVFERGEALKVVFYPHGR